MANDFISNVLSQLASQQLVTPEQLQQILGEVNNNAALALAQIETQHIVPVDQILAIKSKLLNLPVVDLSDRQIPADVLKLIPAATAQNYQMVPFEVAGDVVKVAFTHPEDYQAVEALDFIGQHQKLHFQYFLTAEYSLNHILHQYENLNTAVEEALAKADVGDLDLDLTGEEGNSEEIVKTAPVSKIISVILKNAIEGAASDVHIEPVDNETRVRYRVDGILHTSLVLPLKVHKSLIARIKVLANLKLDETRLPQDGRFKMRIENREVEFRVSTLPLLNNEKVVLRILDASNGVVTLSDLGFQDHNAERIVDDLKRPHGMMLVTGPTGSGKSTSLYSMMSILNTEDVNIITLEDPVEYNLGGIAQSQMKPEIGLTFASALRSVLRQDPDIIMVGEIRDNETAELAVHAALTGHLVLSTIHTNDALGAIPRLIDMGVEPFLIASSLNVIIAQRLVRKICSQCRERIQLSKSAEADVIAEIKLMPVQFLPHDIKLFPPFTAFQGKGCTHCEGTGFHGRVAVCEVLENTKQLSQIIADGKMSQTKLLQDECRRQGMFNMRQDGLIKVFRGLTTLEEVWNATKT